MLIFGIGQLSLDTVDARRKANHAAHHRQTKAHSLLHTGVGDGWLAEGGSTERCQTNNPVTTSVYLLVRLTWIVSCCPPVLRPNIRLMLVPSAKRSQESAGKQLFRSQLTTSLDKVEHLFNVQARDVLIVNFEDAVSFLHLATLYTGA